MTNPKVAIITGGSSGIGRATAVAFAKEGTKVVVAAHRVKKGEETVSLVKEALSAMHPIGRTRKPDEVADVVAWLLSDRASFIVGHTLLADGGVVSR